MPSLDQPNFDNIFVKLHSYDDIYEPGQWSDSSRQNWLKIRSEFEFNSSRRNFVVDAFEFGFGVVEFSEFFDFAELGVLFS